MILLMLFAFVAGIGTAITPCVLPVLPALLSASALGGRRRPFGIVLGLAITFTIAIVALATIAKGVGLASGATRTLAVVVLISFGLVMLIPGLAVRVQAPLSRLGRFGPKSRGSGFWSGLGVGGALGPIWDVEVDEWDYTFDVLAKGGRNPTRAKVMDATLHLNEPHNIALIPGMVVRTSPADRFPVRQEQLARYEGGMWKLFGPIIDARK